MKFDAKTFEFHFEYDITFTGVFENGVLQVPKDYPKGTYKLKKGTDFFETIDSGNDFYETLHLLFKELDRERLGESNIPTPQTTTQGHHNWTDIHSVSSHFSDIF